MRPGCGYEERTMAVEQKQNGGSEAVDGQERAASPHEGLVLLRRYRLDAVLYSSGWGDFWLAEDLGEPGEVSEEKAAGAESEAAELPPVRILALRSDVHRSKRTLWALRSSVEEASRLYLDGLSAARQLFTVGDQYYVLCDPIVGYPFSVVLANSEGHRRPYEELKGLASSLAEVLDYAHARGVMNTNIRPGAVTVWEDRTLADLSGFGIRSDLGGGRRTVLSEGNGAGRWLGYVAPEVLSRKWGADDASDQYALGALMWHALFGTAPMPGGNPQLPPGATSLAPKRALDALCRALSKAPRARFASCGDFARAFGGERVIRRRGISAMEKRTILRRLRNTVLALLGGAAVAGIVLGIVMGVRYIHDRRGGRRVVHDIAPAAVGGPLAEVAAEAVGAQPLQDCTESLEVGRNYRASDGMEFVWVPTMRCWVGRFEVTNGEFREFDADHYSGDFQGVSLDDDRQPAVKIRFSDATDFANWMDRREHMGGRIPDGYEVRLPDRNEAMRYAQAGSDRTYPWGDRLPPRFGNYADAALKEQGGEAVHVLDNYRDSFVASCPVEFSGENDWGLFGTGGNVWETTIKPGDKSSFGGWHGGAYDTSDPQRITTRSFYGYLGNARGAVNGVRLIIAEKPAPAEP